MPQVMLFYSLLCGSFGLFTVAYFCCELLVQDIGCLVKVAVGSHSTRKSQDELAFQIFRSSMAHGSSFLECLLQGAETVMQMGELVKKGVDVYLLRSMPVIFVVVVVVASVPCPQSWVVSVHQSKH